MYAKELLHSLQCLLFLLVLLVFFFTLLVCLFVFLFESTSRQDVMFGAGLEHFSNKPFFFTFESHWCGQCCGSYNTCSWNVRPFFARFCG